MIDQYVLGDVSGLFNFELNLARCSKEVVCKDRVCRNGMEQCNSSDASDTYLEGNFLISSKFSNKFLTKAK